MRRKKSTPAPPAPPPPDVEPSPIEKAEALYIAHVPMLQNLVRYIPTLAPLLHLVQLQKHAMREAFVGCQPVREWSRKSPEEWLRAWPVNRKADKLAFIRAIQSVTRREK